MLVIRIDLRYELFLVNQLRAVLEPDQRLDSCRLMALRGRGLLEDDGARRLGSG